MSTLAAAERAALLDLMTDAGPDSPTLCAGWTTYDMAAHLVVRERRPQAVPGLVVGALHPVTARLEERARTTSYDELLGLLRAGAPLWSPVRWVDDLHEFYVHHEDVRRPLDPGPRRDGAELDDALWKRLRVLGPLFAVRARGLGIVLADPAGRTMRVRRGPQEAVLRGTPRELFLWIFGRRGAADVAVEGSPDVVERVRTAPIGP